MQRTVQNPSGAQIVGAGTIGNQSWPEANRLASAQKGGERLFSKGKQAQGLV